MDRWMNAWDGRIVGLLVGWMGLNNMGEGRTISASFLLDLVGDIETTHTRNAIALDCECECDEHHGFEHGLDWAVDNERG
jgi:hypothetical protein